jgi:hypothetical protein
MSIPFIYGKHDYQDFYRWTTQGLDKIFEEHKLKILLLNKRGGTFLSIVALLTNYIQQSFLEQVRAGALTAMVKSSTGEP